ncbi:MAG: M56 family metallopeptidase [Dysgonomonas sp.]|nr:M56 family metallopeptidase [Dysgonomonas sp.]
MDNTLIIYGIKSAISIALFYGVYMLFMRNDTFLSLRRFYFLFAILFSLIFPLISIELSSGLISTQSVIPSYWLSQIVIGADVESIQEQHINIWDIVTYCILIISLFFTVRFIFQLYSIIKFRKENSSEIINNVRIVKLQNDKGATFSFFHWIFIDTDSHTEQQLDKILKHEHTHVKQLHSIDIILVELFCICFWWNPFAWLLRKELKVNLEYIADQGVLLAGFDSKTYQYTLLQASNIDTGIPIINNFNVSQLKKRIIMMNKKKSSIFASIKYLLIVPLGVAMIFGNAAQASSDMNNELYHKDNNQLVEVQSIEQKKVEPLPMAEKLPAFVGGESAMFAYFRENVKYPEDAMKADVEGRVIIRFVVDKEGNISNAELIKGVYPSIDEEALRVIKAMPKWIPGEEKGKKVDVYFTIPVHFALKGKKPTEETAN